MPFPAESLELARLRALGQLPPSDVDYEGPSDYVSPTEQSQMLPRGLTPAHAGGLQNVAMASRLQDSLSTPPPPPAPQPSAEQGANRSPAGPAAIAASGPAGPGVAWANSDPAALAEAARSQKDLGAEADLMHTAGHLIRLATSAGVGGIDSLPGSGGAAAGTEAGASSGAGFGASYGAGFMQGGGSGVGGFLGRLSSGLLTDKTTGAQQDSTARLLATLYGMA